ncbi:MAG: hypothetical protein HY609_04710 [Deltaproteobacteria bacterium]|nr:hypothetical protein [Deltaproteobacteria bacterium]MBI4224212.1 hypothetical protein [Deltaproteobacteria bacterium]
MADAPKPSLGYPHVEKLIDSEDFDEINRSFQKAYADLEKISKEKRGLGKGKEAKQAMQALEKCSELLKELLQIKYRLQEEIKKQAKK